MHQLKYYASAFSEHPAEVLYIPDGSILGEWLKANVAGFDPELTCLSYSLPFDSEVRGDVIVNMVPKGNTLQSILKPVFKLLGINVSKPSSQAQVRGDDITIATFQGNQVKYGQPVREIFGRVKVYPDYLVPRRTYFQNLRDHWATMLLCVGVGPHEIAASSITFGDTPVIALGGGAYAQVYQPGESLVGEVAAEWWHNAPEVGQTSTGNAGLPLETTYEATRSAPIGTYLISGFTISPTSGQLFPSDWQSGMYLNIRYLQTFAASGNTLVGDFSGLQVSAGDVVTLSGSYQGNFTVQSYTPAQGATGGTPSVWTAQSGPSLDYSVTPAQFSVSAGAVSGFIAINGTYANQSALVSALNSALSATSLNGIVQFGSGLVITEMPGYAARRITVTNISAADRAFGDITAANNSTVVGIAGNPGIPAQLQLINFVADSPTVELSISKLGQRYVLTGASPNLITVDRVDQDGDSDWGGWGSGFATRDIEITLGADSTQGGWVGNFKATPANELCNALEFDIFMPQGLVGIDGKGRRYEMEVRIEFRYRSSSELPWQYLRKTYRYNQKDQIAFTERINFAVPTRISECAMRRTNPESESSQESNKAEWYGLRTRIVGVPTSYPNFTTVAVRVRGSSSLGVDADEMLGLIATRILNGIPERRISKAVEYIARRTAVDSVALAELESIWIPRGDSFDHSFETASTVKQAVKTALAVGFADFTMDDGIMTPVRDQLIPPELMYAFWQTFSAQNTTQPISTTFELSSDDEVDGVDVEYLDQNTWRVETVRCMELGSEGLKIEKVKAEGITNRNRAYRFGMRRLMTIKTDREQIKTETELSGLNAGYGRLANFVNEVPGWSQSSVLKSLQGNIVESADILDWQESGDHVFALRRPDGTLTQVFNAARVSETRIQFSGALGFTPIPYDTQLFFGQREIFSTPAIIRQVNPSGSNRVKLMAIAYNPDKYIYDNAEADN